MGKSTINGHIQTTINICSIRLSVKDNISAFLGQGLPGVTWLGRTYHDQLPSCLPSSCHSSPEDLVTLKIWPIPLPGLVNLQKAINNGHL
jgi:hypothetical protein